MSRAKRVHLASRPSSSATAAPADLPRNRRGWLFAQHDRSQSRRADNNDGTSFPDDIILWIFAALVGLADLLRCAATCRQWRRLVSDNAISIVRSLRQAGKYIPPLAVGFLQHCPSCAEPLFVPLASAFCRFTALRKQSLSLNTVVDNELFASSRILTSRNGLLVIELHRGRNSRVLKLCVFNPMTGDVHVLPTLSGKDGLRHYACTVLTAGDHRSFHLIMLYRRRDFTAFRSYSSANNNGGWSPERRVTGAQLSKMQIPETRCGVVDSDGRAAYWISRRLVFGLRLDTLEATVARLPGLDGCEAYTMDNTLVGMTPEGRLCAVQIKMPFLADLQDNTMADTIVIRLVPYGGHGNGFDNGVFQLDNNLWMEDDSIQITHSFPGNVRQTVVKLQWFCERSGIVFFTAVKFGVRAELYAVNLSTREVDKIASRPGNCLWNDVYGYEMDEVAYLTSLGLEQE